VVDSAGRDSRPREGLRMYTKTAIRFDPQTGALEVKSDISNPKAVVKVLLQAIATIVDQQGEQEPRIVTPPGIVVPG
jgi:hypothetical protein